jgi:O-antigen ligase
MLAYWCGLVALLVPLRLTLAYAALIPLILFTLIEHPATFSLTRIPPSARRAAAAFLFFLCSLLISSFFGIDPQRSLRPFCSLVFFSSTILIFTHFARVPITLRALLIGQTIASIHSVLDALFPEALPKLFNGTVTESGQMAMTSIIAGSIAWSAMHPSTAENTRPRLHAALLSGLLTLALATICFAQSPLIEVIALGIGVVIVARLFRLHHRADNQKDGERWKQTVYLQIPFIITALLVNLKRGPWLGVLVGSLIFALLYAPQIFGALIAVVILVSVSVTPIRDRLLASYEHFTISGGRSTIWQIGGELISRYPLGIGYHNSPILQKFSPEIPPELKHFHNNLLNITAENGWLSTMLFIWFLVELLRLCFARPRSITRNAIGCALISWQIAGLVEYNFGDSEVSLVAWILIGLLFRSNYNTPAVDPFREASTGERQLP